MTYKVKDGTNVMYLSNFSLVDIYMCLGRAA